MRSIGRPAAGYRLFFSVQSATPTQCHGRLMQGSHKRRFPSPRKVRQWCYVFLVFTVLFILIKTWPRSVILQIPQRDNDAPHQLLSHRLSHLLRAEFSRLIRHDIPAVEDVGETMLRDWVTLEQKFCNQIVDNYSHPFATDACQYSCEHKDDGTGTSPSYVRRNLLVIPFRDRYEHLRELIPRLEYLLNKQNICYLIVVSEQVGTEPFNKGKLMNAAFVEALQWFPFHCITLHDVDLLALSDDTPYTCPTFPQHTSVNIDKFHSRLPYIELVGGILSLPIKVYLRVNGFSNLYWGWGAEDDDMYERLTVNGIPVTRPNPKIATFKMLQHIPSPAFPLNLRSQILALGEARYRLDGLNSLNYTLVDQKMQFYDDTLVGNMTDKKPREDSAAQHWLIHLKIDVGQAPAWLGNTNLRV